MSATRSDNPDLGFAWACLLAGAITFDEFRTWAEHVVTVTPADDLPPYMIDVMMAEDRLSVTTGLRNLIGFWPSDPLLEGDGRSAALSGLTALRGTHRPDDAGMSAQQSLAALTRHPEIAARFAAVFPFLPNPQVAA